MNLPWELPDERLITKINQLIRFVIFENPQRVQQLNDRFIFINCSYDKSLTAFSDEHGDGEIAITDRSKITRLLSILNHAKKKPVLVVIDLLLQDAPSDQDSLLTVEMAQTNNLILGWDKSKGGFDLPPKIQKAEAYYFSSSGSFLKYPVLNTTGTYLPAAIYTNLHPEIRPHLSASGFVIARGEIWLNSFIVDMEVREHAMNYFNLGELLDAFPEKEIQNIAQGKILMMGEFFHDDQHETVLGRQPGPLLVANTFLSLEKGQASITWTGSLLLLMFYFIMTWRIMSMSLDRPMGSTKPKTSKLTRFLLKYATYLVVFSVFSIIIYQLLDKHFQILLFAFYFNALEFSVKRYSGFKENLSKHFFRSGQFPQ